MVQKVIILRGYFDSYQPEYKRMRILLTEDDFTEKYLATPRPGKSPTFMGGFYVKYTLRSEYFINTAETVIDGLVGEQVRLEVLPKIYNHPNIGQGWNLTLKKMHKDNMLS